MTKPSKEQVVSPEDSKHLNERTIEEIRKARAEISAGKAYSLERVKKELNL
jgi:hypothetical protein